MPYRLTSVRAASAEGIAYDLRHDQMAILEIATCRVVYPIRRVHDQCFRQKGTVDTRSDFSPPAVLHASGGGTTTCS
jgi:hypothetical protein